MQLTELSGGQSGVTLIEVLIAIVIMSVGLLGLAGLFATVGRTEVEAYQRVQALAYLKDMEDRIATNRDVVPCYVASTYGGNGTLPICTAGTLGQQSVANADIAAWNSALLGASEKIGAAAVGQLVGAVGCVESLGTAVVSGTTIRDFRLSVAWQGLEDVSTPDATLTCGAAAYTAAGVPGRRRVVSSLLRVPEL